MTIRGGTSWIVLGLLLVPALSSAQAPPPPPKHEGTAEAAFVGVSGNAQSNTFGLGGEVIARPGIWVFKHKASFIRNEAAGTVTAQAILYTPRAEARLNSRLGVFAEYLYFRDRFAGIENRNAVTGGLSVKAIDQKAQTLALDVGGGYLKETRLAGPNISSAIYTLGSAYRLKMSSTSELADDLGLTGNASDTSDWRLVHGIALTASMSTVLSLKVSNVIRYAHRPAPGFKTMDSTTSVALVARFPGKK
jgi:putative salt-induced outer membrane protein YdiY